MYLVYWYVPIQKSHNTILVLLLLYKPTLCKLVLVPMPSEHFSLRWNVLFAFGYLGAKMVRPCQEFINCYSKILYRITELTLTPLTISLLGMSASFSLAFEKFTTTVLLALNFRPHSSLHSSSLVTTFSILLIIWCKKIPPFIAMLSSAKTWPKIISSFRITTASSYATPQNFALHTPPVPCGNLYVEKNTYRMFSVVNVFLYIIDSAW